MQSVLKIIDSHTGGEATRIIVSGGPELGHGKMSERLDNFKNNFDQIRKSVVNEPRGSSSMVGALLCEPVDPNNAAGVIFFNNSGYLGMCGHGLIGLAVTLFYQNKITLGLHIIETPVGLVSIELLSANQVKITNIASYRFAKNVTLDVAEFGQIKGDIAWGGNWFFLVKNHGLELLMSHVEQLLDYTKKVKVALVEQNITGSYNAEIDHIELCSDKNLTNNADNRNFVLCPGNEYDRSPCGTGTSAKLACLFEDGELQAGQIWRQQGIVGSVFEGSIQVVNNQLIPSISGDAYITLESTVIFDPLDPYRFGI